jgi:hypothetical protein
MCQLLHAVVTLATPEQPLTDEPGLPATLGTLTLMPKLRLASPGSPFSPFNPFIPGRPWGTAWCWALANLCPHTPALSGS